MSKSDDGKISDMAKPNLAFVTTDELVTELINRHVSLVIVAIPKNNPDSRVLNWSGGMAQVVGLANIAHQRLLQIAMEPDKDTNGE